MAKWKPSFTVEGITLPLPNGYSQGIEDLVSSESGRTLDGQAIKDVVAVKTNIPMKWEKIEWNIASQLAKAIDGKNSLKCQIMDVRNPYTMTEVNIYVGARSFSPSRFDTDGKVYWDIEFSEIEL